VATHGGAAATSSLSPQTFLSTLVAKFHGTARVGVQIAEPTENWLRLFVSWVADEQPAADPAVDPGASSE